MIYKTPFHGHRGSGELGLPVPPDVLYRAKDMRALVQEQIMQNYDPKTPIEGGRPILIRFAAYEDDEESQTILNAPKELSESLERFYADHPDSSKVAFVMMQFGHTPAHEKIVDGIRAALSVLGVAAVRAYEKEYHNDLFYNILTYMHGCGFGIAVFERLEEDSFNPNVSMEVGYMLALRKPICLLKDKTLKTLPTDFIGKLYRVFDPQEPTSTIPGELSRWLKDNAARIGLESA